MNGSLGSRALDMNGSLGSRALAAQSLLLESPESLLPPESELEELLSLLQLPELLALLELEEPSELQLNQEPESSSSLLRQALHMSPPSP